MEVGIIEAHRWFYVTHHVHSIRPRPHRSSIIARLRPETAPALALLWPEQQLGQRRSSGAAVRRPGGTAQTSEADSMLRWCNRLVSGRQLAPGPEQPAFAAAAAASSLGPCSSGGTSAASASFPGSAPDGSAAAAAVGVVVAAAAANEPRIAP